MGGRSKSEDSGLSSVHGGIILGAIFADTTARDRVATAALLRITNDKRASRQFLPNDLQS
jgi:hypothetical protein